MKKDQDSQNTPTSVKKSSEEPKLHGSQDAPSFNDPSITQSKGRSNLNSN